MTGAEIPESFLVALVLPLRKNGDSDLATDYRSISLLQSIYKILAMILAERVQGGLGSIIGDEQQGFVKARLLERAVVVMQAVLAQAYDDPDVSIDDEPLAVLIDYMKSYDTLSRGYMLMVVRKFGFAPNFIELVARLHDGTKAHFLVNGEISKPVAVLSGIRQGCPLAPLLFIIAVEPLVLMLRQDSGISGIHVQTERAGEVRVSSFVDDTAVFLRRDNRLPRLLKLLSDFEAMSGLKAQPAKSSLISLNTAISQNAHHGIAVVDTRSSTRYLGVQVGHGDTARASWSKRIAGLSVRLAMATRVTTSVVGRVKIMNTIALPAIIFTAQFVRVSDAVLNELVNLQKHFVWHGRLSTDCCRYKMAPSLVYAPTVAGGLGLQSIPLAIKAQAMRRATTWLLARDSAHKECWKYLVSLGVRNAIQERNIQPRAYAKATRTKMMKHATIYCQGKKLISEYMISDEDRPAGWANIVSEKARQALAKVQLLWHDDYTTTLHLDPAWKHPRVQTSPEVTNFWPALDWEHNAWLVDENGRQLTSTTHGYMRNCRLHEIELARETYSTYRFKAPLTAKQWTANRIDKMRSWIVAIVAGSPELTVGQRLEVSTQVTLRAAPSLARHFEWHVTGHGEVTGSTLRSKGVYDKITLRRSADRWLW